MCPAEMQYAQALRLFADPTIDQRRADAAQICLVATPAPLDGVTPHLTPQPVLGFTYGRLAYPVYNAQTGGYDLYALYTDGRILRAADQRRSALVGARHGARCLSRPGCGWREDGAAGRGRAAGICCRLLGTGVAHTIARQPPSGLRRTGS